MAVNLTKGQRVSLDKGVKLALVGLGWDTNRYVGAADFDLDASAFMLGANGKVRKDADFIFSGNLQSEDGSVTHTGDSLSGGSGGDDETLFIDFTKVPQDVEKIVITVTIYEAQERGQNFGQALRRSVRSALSSSGTKVPLVSGWTPAHVGDAAPSIHTTKEGFLSGLEPDFLAVRKIWPVDRFNFIL